ncbi:MAG: DUF427 domain-containing protein [Rhodospirillaceae bacterium]|nr:DUF427 domain-containing protein [Rhodospirillaceae bacterium]
MTPESVWDYPRPPAVRPDTRRVRVEFAGVTIADTARAIRVLETSHPPSFYIPPADVRMDLFTREDHASFCEWKGEATYWIINVAGQISENAAWSYARPTKAFASIKDHLAFYASRVHACFVGDERVTPQEGNFYGGWITPEIKGPFKGPPGTRGW